MITLEEEHQVLTDLHSIARELNKPFDDGDVLGEYSKRNNGCSKEIAHYVIHPIYFPPEECIINNSKDTMNRKNCKCIYKLLDIECKKRNNCMGIPKKSCPLSLVSR